MSKSLFIASTMAFSLVGFYLGYFQRTPDEVDEKMSAILLESQDSKGSDLKKSLEYSLSVSAEMVLTDNPPLIPIRKGLDQMNRTEKDQQMANALGNDETGKDLFRILSVAYHPLEVPGSEIYVNSFLKKLQENPVQGISLMNRILDQLPATEFPLERSSALHQMAKLPGYSETTHAKALAEITSYAPDARPDPTTAQTLEEKQLAGNTSYAIILPTSAHQIYIDSSSDPTEALNGTIRAIAFQQDTGIRMSMEVQYLKKYPTMHAKFQEEVAAQNIQFPKWANDHLRQVLAMGNGLTQ